MSDPIFKLTLAVVILVVSATTVSAAPAPFQRRPAKPTLLEARIQAGPWDATWMGTRCTLTFGPDGRYHCLWCGTNWDGVYEVSSGVLYIAEWSRRNPVAEPLRWRVRLCPHTLKGPTLDSDYGYEQSFMDLVPPPLKNAPKF